MSKERQHPATGVRVEIDLDGAGALCVCVQDDGLGERRFWFRRRLSGSGSPMWREL